MNNVLFTAILGICILSMANCESYSGDYVIAESTDRTFNELSVAGNLLVSGSGAVKVIGNALIEGDMEHSGSGVFRVTGTLTVRGILTRRGSGKVSAGGGIIN